jgi:hypothetical protein
VKACPAPMMQAASARCEIRGILMNLVLMFDRWPMLWRRAVAWNFVEAMPFCCYRVEGDGLMFVRIGAVGCG